MTKLVTIPYFVTVNDSRDKKSTHLSGFNKIKLLISFLALVIGPTGHIVFPSADLKPGHLNKVVLAPGIVFSFRNDTSLSDKFYYNCQITSKSTRKGATEEAI